MARKPPYRFYDENAYGPQNAAKVREAFASPSAAVSATLRLPPAPPLRKGERAPLETTEQRLFFRRVREFTQYFPVLRYVTAVPNGGFRRRVEAAILIGEGVNPGCPDVFLPYPSRDYHGWFGELKRIDANDRALSDDQKRWLAWLREQGFRAEMHAGHAAMWNDLVDYLELDKPNTSEVRI